jgi:AraC family transcriptional regulator
MQVQIVDFQEIKVAAAEHRGPPELEYETSKRLIAWRMQNALPPNKHATYGIHYTDPNTTAPADHRVDFCVSYAQPVQPNPQGIVSKIIPANRCARVRHFGSRSHNTAAIFLYRDWLPSSGESFGNFPIFFHYVNVGLDIPEQDMITDVYLPLRSSTRDTPT